MSQRRRIERLEDLGGILHRTARERRAAAAEGREMARDHAIADAIRADPIAVDEINDVLLAVSAQGRTSFDWTDFKAERHPRVTVILREHGRF